MMENPEFVAFWLGLVVAEQAAAAGDDGADGVAGDGDEADVELVVVEPEMVGVGVAVVVVVASAGVVVVVVVGDEVCLGHPA